jgi:ABC-2 type transport system ATP-binding protein
VLDELDLGSRASQRIGQLDTPSKRALGLALAIVGDPPLLLLDQPLSGLEPDAVRRQVVLLSRALRGRQALVTVEPIGSSPEQDSLLAAVSEVLVLGGDGLTARGALSELSRTAASYRVVVSRGGDALRERLGALGFEISALAGAPPGALRVDDPLGHGTCRLLGAAAGIGAPVVELSPLAFRRLAP